MSEPHTKQRPVKRSAFSGKIVNGYDVILVTEIEEYLTKQNKIIVENEKGIFD